MLRSSCEKLSELEISYKSATEQLEALKISNCLALNELEENYRIKCAEMNLEINMLKAEIEKLNHNLIQMEQKQQRQQNISGNNR